MKSIAANEGSGVLKGASIIGGITNSEISCTIRNQNSGGAELKVPVESRVPERFVLYVPTDGVAYQAVLRWRRNDLIGVQFIGTCQSRVSTMAKPMPGMHRLGNLDILRRSTRVPWQSYFRGYPPANLRFRSTWSEG